MQSRARAPLASCAPRCWRAELQAVVSRRSGILVIKGRYATSPKESSSEHRYIQEEKVWKLMTFSIAPRKEPSGAGACHNPAATAV